MPHRQAGDALTRSLLTHSPMRLVAPASLAPSQQHEALSCSAAECLRIDWTTADYCPERGTCASSCIASLSLGWHKHSGDVGAGGGAGCIDTSEARIMLTEAKTAVR